MTTPGGWTRVKIVRLNGKPGRPYVVRWRERGRWRQVTIPRRYARHAARREVYRAQIEDRLNGLVQAAHDPITLETAVREFLESRKTKGAKPSTVRTYRHVLERFRRAVRVREVREVTPQVLGRFLAGRRVKPATLRRDWVHLKAFFGWAVRRGQIPAVPLDKEDAPRALKKRAVFYTEAEVRAVLETVRNWRTWVQACVRLAVLSGLRTGELEALSAGDLDFKARLVRVPAQKSAEDRYVAFDADTGGLLHELAYRGECILWGPPDDPFVTGGTFRRRLAADARKICQAAGVRVPAKPIQYLRGTFGTMAARAGVPVFVLQQVLGHQAVQTTREFYYGPRAAEDAASAQRAVSKALENENG